MRTFILPIHPVPKARPRLNRKSGKIYTPGKTASFQNEIRKWVCLNLGKYFDYPMYEKGIAVSVDVDFIYKRTKVLAKKRFPDGFLWKETGDDKDNLEKSVLDALTGILWHDDCQVVTGRTRKMWAPRGEESRICLLVKTAGDPPAASCDFWNADIMDSLSGRKDGE